MESLSTPPPALTAGEIVQSPIIQSLRSAVRYLQRPDQPSLMAQCHAQELAHIADQLESELRSALRTDD